MLKKLSHFFGQAMFVIVFVGLFCLVDFGVTGFQKAMHSNPQSCHYCSLEFTEYDYCFNIYIKLPDGHREWKSFHVDCFINWRNKNKDK
jgi:hypothetical protein